MEEGAGEKEVKTALITTTINVPRVLELYRKFAPDDCRFFVALDKRSADLRDWVFKYRGAGDPETIIIGPEAQEHWECSDFIGWNNDSRRNIALLEALKWGAELIVSVDDDMIPCQGEFPLQTGLFEWDYDGLQLGAAQHWFDAGRLTIPAAGQRGLPAGVESIAPADFVVDAKIGAAQGIILGVPDTDACTAINQRPYVYAVSDVLRNGFVVHPQAYAVFNSQITAFRRELAPAFAQFYNHQSRNTDIFASLLMRRIMQERNLYTYYGPPMGFHARQPRPLFKDLKAEMWGLEHVEDFTDHLRRAPIKGVNVVDDCRLLMNGYGGFTLGQKKAAEAWYNDVEKVYWI
jgi:hypothetical protein